MMTLNSARRSVLIIAGLVALWAGGVADARAQGYGLYEMSACMMGRTGAGVASPCNDGSAMFFNPAALSTDTSVISGGDTPISPRGQFTNSGTNVVSPLSEQTYLPPSAYAAFPLNTRVVVGAGLFVPYGLGVEWPAATSEGRFLGYKSQVRAFYVQPTVKVKVNDYLSIGGGIDITHITVELRRRVDLSSVPVTGAPPGVTFQTIGVPPGTDFADVALTGSGNSVGGHIGVLAKASDRLSFGARYLFRQHVNVDNGQVATTQIATNLTLRVPLGATLPAGTPIDRIVAPVFAAGQALGPQTATTTIPLPGQFVIGVAGSPADHLWIFADYQMTLWSIFDQIVIQNQVGPATVLKENYSDTHGVRIGVEYDLGHGAAIRGGFDAHGAGAPDQSITPILPEASRKEVAVGGSIPVVSHVGIDLAYQYVNQSDRAGTTNGVVNNGTYHYNANLFGASVVLKW
jgi:long-chain fatty acid transport protein